MEIYFAGCIFTFGIFVGFDDDWSWSFTDISKIIIMSSLSWFMAGCILGDFIVSKSKGKESKCDKSSYQS